MGGKAIVALLIGLVLGSVHLAEAQEAKKVPRIGRLSAGFPSATGRGEALKKGLRDFGYIEGSGDRFAAEWPVAEFREHGIGYEQCEQNKSELYLSFVP
jgi:hypothetical protein